MTIFRTHFIAVICLVFFLLPDQILAQQVKISGNSNAGPNKIIRVIVYADQFSKLEKTLAKTVTDKNGNFELAFDMAYTDYAFLAEEMKRGEFYLSPNSSYEFKIFKDTISQAGSIFDELPLQFSYEANDDGLSDDITTFNIQYNNFLYTSGNMIYRGREKQFIKDYILKTKQIFKPNNLSYYNDYVDYTLGWLEWISKTKNDSIILSEYFTEKPILYNNIQYTDFLIEFTRSYFGYNRIFSYDELVKAINYNGFADVEGLVKRDRVLASNDQLSELMSILVMTNKYYSSDVKKDKVIEKLEELSRKSKYQEHRKIAENYIRKLTALETDTPAPAFSLTDQHGQQLSLKDFSGKMILISFVKGDCRICREHLSLLEEIRKSQNQKLQILTIVYGDDYAEIVKYASARSFDWPFLNLGNNFFLLEAYNIRAYPSYVIVYPDGKIAMATAPMPDENLELFIQRHSNRFKEIQEGQ